VVHRQEFYQINYCTHVVLRQVSSFTNTFFGNRKARAQCYEVPSEKELQDKDEDSVTLQELEESLMDWGMAGVGADGFGKRLAGPR
jgi:hypothetical protein